MRVSCALVLMFMVSCVGTYTAYHESELTQKWMATHPEYVQQWCVTTGKPAEAFTIVDMPATDQVAIHEAAKTLAEKEVGEDTAQSTQGAAQVATSIATGNYVGAGVGLIALIGVLFGVGKKLKGGKKV